MAAPERFSPGSLALASVDLVLLYFFRPIFTLASLGYFYTSCTRGAFGGLHSGLKLE
jgi:hypothetical protein